MIKYRASVISKKITTVDAIRETEKFVVLNCRSGEFKEAKTSEYTAYFDSFEGAKSWLIGQFDLKVKRAESVLRNYKYELELVLSLEPQKDD